MLDVTVTILIFVAGIILFVLSVMEHPYFFHHSLRFVYRSGLLIYSRTFKVHAQTDKFDIPRWKIEHWMAASGFSLPYAVEDGKGRYLFAEFVYSLFIPPALLMRGKISWDNQEKNVIVRGYATWGYFSVLVLCVVMLFIPSNVVNICGGIFFFFYLLWCAWVYLHQVPHFNSIGTKVADYLSSDEE